MRIAYVCADRGIPVQGNKGASVHVRAITSALQRRGNDVVLIATRLGEGNPAPGVGELVVADPLDGDAMAAAVGASGADVVLERYALESGPARRASAALGVPHVLEVNAPLVLEASRYRGLSDVDAALARERLTFEEVDAVAVVSSALEEYVRHSSASTPVRVIPNAADVDWIASSPPLELGLGPGVALGFVGSMKPWHGMTHLLDAFTVVAATHPVRLVLAGSGPEETAVRHRVDSDPMLRDRVRVLGVLPHERVGSLLRSLDIGVAPFLPAVDFYFSPLKVREYLAAGLPVVHPGLGELAEVVGPAGVSYPPGDVTGLAEAIAALADDPGRRVTLAAEAVRRSRRWTWDDAARAVEELLETTLATTGVS